MAYYAANPHATRNLRNGQVAYFAKAYDAEAVLRRYLADRPGTASDYWFAQGYREAAEAHGMPRQAIEEAVRYVDPVRELPIDDDIRRVEIECDVQLVRYGSAPMAWKLAQLMRKKAEQEAAKALREIAESSGD